MDTVTTPSRMRDVVSSGRLAVIIGIEMDNIGNFYNPNEKRSGEVYTPNPTEAQVRREIDRLFGLGVRYIFPVHIVNNAFGGAGVYGDGMEPILFNLSNYYLTGSAFQVERVSTASSGIGFKFPDLSRLTGGPAKVAIDILRHAPLLPLKPDVLDISRYSYIDSGDGYGHRNRLGLSDLGKYALRYMMSKGMMIDIDHMSERSVSDALWEAVRFDYPLNSGHNGPRGRNGSEQARTNGQYDSLRTLGGMVGVGTGSAEAAAFVGTYRQVLAKMGGRNVTIGTDVGVGAKLPAAPGTAGKLAGDLPGIEPCRTGNKTWTFADYNKEGVSHYGMMPEFVRSIENAGLNTAEKNAFFGSVEYFAQMWEKCERSKRNIR
jgi:microsomal dipeptidase-like Zn-dependent dipeptidase